MEVTVRAGWERFEGVYPEPSQAELEMIRRYLYKFRLEEDDFNEDEDQDWVALKESVRCPNLRALMIKFLHQVRESKVLNITINFDSING